VLGELLGQSGPEGAVGLHPPGPRGGRRRGRRFASGPAVRVEQLGGAVLFEPPPAPDEADASQRGGEPLEQLEDGALRTLVLEREVGEVAQHPVVEHRCDLQRAVAGGLAVRTGPPPLAQAQVRELVEAQSADLGEQFLRRPAVDLLLGGERLLTEQQHVVVQDEVVEEGATGLDVLDRRAGSGLARLS
jgi:hypothetical protein